MKLRNYQVSISEEATSIIRKYGFVYLALEVRTGKTLIALTVAHLNNYQSVLFLTKKKAISSILSDYKMSGYQFKLTAINYESCHKITDDHFDLIILDEAHSMGAMPKPSKRAKQIKEYLRKNKSTHTILMSGTPTPESFSQMYHQVYGIINNPFNHYTSFYKFAKDYVDIKQKKINGMLVNDYSKGKESIIELMRPYTINYTQKEAGFSSDIQEHIIYVDMEENTYNYANHLKKNRVIQGKTEVILADTPVKLKQKLHQLYSGTIKFESGNAMVLDYSKADFIKEYFKGKKIGIFYKFIAELQAIKEVFKENVCFDIDEFNKKEGGEECQAIALQIVSGREGISLRNADFLVNYNIDFSATSYWQSRDRMTTKDRLSNDVYWIFARNGIEDSIYQAVSNKKDYTLKHFNNYIS